MVVTAGTCSAGACRSHPGGAPAAAVSAVVGRALTTTALGDGVAQGSTMSLECRGGGDRDTTEASSQRGRQRDGPLRFATLAGQACRKSPEHVTTEIACLHGLRTTNYG